MHRPRTSRAKQLAEIGVDRAGAKATEASSTLPQQSWLRMENLDVNIPPDPIVAETTRASITDISDNSYLPFIGQKLLREKAAQHVQRMTREKVSYNGEQHCVISAGGLSGILNVLLALVEPGHGVLLTDPTYAGLINRVKLAGAVPVMLPLVFNPGGYWLFDRLKLRSVIAQSPVPLSAVLFCSPALPSGMVLTEDDWAAIAEECINKDLLLINDTAFERLLFDKQPAFHPASLPGMAERTITVGSASKELRMIGWRVGWVVGPENFIADVRLIGMANVVVPVGIAQRAAARALEESYETIDTFIAELEARRDICMAELKGLPVGIPAGGWSFVMRVTDLGWTGQQAAAALFEQGICVTSMDGWGEEHGSQYVRFIFSNVTREDLLGLGAKVRTALKVIE